MCSHRPRARDRRSRQGTATTTAWIGRPGPVTKVAYRTPPGCCPTGRIIAAAGVGRNAPFRNLKLQGGDEAGWSRLLLGRSFAQVSGWEIQFRSKPDPEIPENKKAPELSAQGRTLTRIGWRENSRGVTNAPAAYLALILLQPSRCPGEDCAVRTSRCAR